MLDNTAYRFHPTRRQANGWPRKARALDAVRLPPHIARITRDHTHIGLAIGLNASNAMEAITSIRGCVAAIRDGYATARAHDAIAEALADLRRARRLHSNAIQVAARLARAA
jgi:hypothetical protein